MNKVHEMLSPLNKRRLSAVGAGALFVVFAVWCVSLLTSVGELRGDVEERVGWLMTVQDIRAGLQEALKEDKEVDLDALGRKGLALLSRIDRERGAEGLGPLKISEALTIDFGLLTTTDATSSHAHEVVLRTVDKLNVMTHELRSDTGRISQVLGGKWDSLNMLAIFSMVLALVAFLLLILFQSKAQRLSEASASLEEKIAEQARTEETLRENRAHYKALSADLDLKNQLHDKALARQAQQATQERQAEVVKLAGKVAHEINNTLTIISLSSQFIEGSLEPGSPAEEDVENLNEATARLGALARRLHLMGDGSKKEVVAEEEKKKEKAQRRARPGEVVLVVEDEDVIRRFVVSALESAGWRVLGADSVSSALLQASSYTDTIHLLLSDIILPHQSGPELAERLKQSRPETGVLFMSSFSPNELGDHGHELDGHRLLPKPFTPEVLAASVRRAIDEHQTLSAPATR